MKNQRQKDEKGYLRNRSSAILDNRLPPQALELENAVLGAILTEGQGRFEMVADILQNHDCFYSPKNATLWELFRKMNSKGVPVDLISVADECIKRDELREIWTPYELTMLSRDVVSTANVETYCYTILERHKSRELIEITGNVLNSAYTDDVFEVLQYAEDAIFELTLGSTKSEYRSAATIAAENMKAIIERVQNPKQVTGVACGISSIDKITGGWQKSDLIILGANTGLGKTAFALNLALAAAKEGHAVGFFTMEMKDNQLMNRLYAIESTVPLERIKRADLTDSQLEQVAKASDAIGKLPIYIDQEPGLSVFELRAKARKMKTKQGIELLIVDYLQLMTGEGYNRETEIASISRGLKSLAKSLDVPIIALSQLNSNGEVRESKAIEHDANILMILDRPDYKKDSKDLDPSIANTAELKFVKNRDGISGISVALNTELSTQRFYDPSVFDDFQEAPKTEKPYAAFGKSEFDPKEQFINKEEKAPF